MILMETVLSVVFGLIELPFSGLLCMFLQVIEMNGQRALVFVALCLISSVKPAPPGDRLEAKSEKVDVDGGETVTDAPKVDPNEKTEKPQVDRPIILPKKQPELVRRPDHLDAVPLERDGHLNKQFRQEIIFGESKDNKNDAKSEHAAEGKKSHEKMTGEQKEMLLVETFHK